MRIRSSIGLSAIASLALLGCATSFTGSAHIEGGRHECEAKCKEQGMQVAGMVFMGEYSSACVCEIPRTAAQSTRESLLEASAGAAAGAVGVNMQMRRQQQQTHVH